MKYMLLIYGNPAIWQTMSEQERDEVLHLHAALVSELSQSGELVGGAGLANPEDTTTMRRGVPTATSGPLAGGSEQMSAFLVDCATPARVAANSR